MDIDPTSCLRINIKYPQGPALTPTTAAAAKTTIYFGYGSNLWQAQMKTRCPTSKYLGIARLRGYKWIIYERGYANIVKLEAASIDAADEDEEPDYSKEVWGLVYSLLEADEQRLDRNEGVPIAYQKEDIECEFWPAKKPDAAAQPQESRTEGDYDDSRVPHAEASSHSDLGTAPTKRKMLVYINHSLVRESAPKKEYIDRMNQGIHDALKEGMPPAYVRQVMRRFIPEHSS